MKALYHPGSRPPRSRLGLPSARCSRAVHHLRLTSGPDLSSRGYKVSRITYHGPMLTENSSHLLRITSYACCNAKPPRRIPFPCPSLPKPSLPSEPLLSIQDRSSSSASPTALLPRARTSVESVLSAAKTAGTPLSRTSPGFSEFALASSVNRISSRKRLICVRAPGEMDVGWRSEMRALADGADRYAGGVDGI